MRVVTSVDRMQQLANQWRRTGVCIGFVPTMGSLHAGHISLMKRARKRIGPAGKLVASIYVNPTQFGPEEDYTRYPRALRRDRKLCQEAGVDVLFVPNDREMYPNSVTQGFSTFVVEHSVSRRMEGASRPTHFRGVTTVLAKLFNIVLPSVAVFGEKDFQQAAVVRRITRDLNFPVNIVVGPTVREADGLAMSSRNNYLSPTERVQATVLWEATELARKQVRASPKPLAASRLRTQLVRFIHQQPSARVDYLEFFHPDSLEPVRQVKRGIRMALAVFIGKTRLIDNGRL